MSKVIKRGPGPQPPEPRVSGLSGVRPPRRPIIDREEVDARQQAHGILIEAERTAQRILDEAESQAEETRQRGYESGVEEGRALHTEALTRALLGVDRLAEALEPQYIRLVRTCVEEILGEELKLSEDAVVSIVRRALRDARQQREIAIRVHPEDAEALRRSERRLLEMLARATTIEVREDPSISRGGCVVVTELGVIDATLEKQLDSLEAALEAELSDRLHDHATHERER